MSDAALNFQEQADLKLLDSERWQDVLQGSKIVLNRVLSDKAESDEKPEVLNGLSWKEAIALYKQHKAMSYAQERNQDLQNEVAKLDKNQIAAISHIEALSGMLNVGAHIHAQRNQQNNRHGSNVFDRQARRESLKKNMETLKRVYKPEEIAQLYKNLAILMIITPHPTTDKKESQEELFAELIKIAENVAPEQRGAALENWIKTNMSAEIVPHEKQSSKEETKAALDQQELYTNGMLDILEDIQWASDEVLGKGFIDFTDPEFTTDLAERSWHNTDLDGKRVPASVVLAQRIEGASRAANLYLNLLNDENIPAQDREALAEVHGVFSSFVEKLKPLEETLDDIRLMDSGSAQYRQAKKQFNQVFTTTSYQGKTYTAGPSLSGQMIEDMRATLSNNGVSETTQKAVKRLIMAYNQNGMALGRQQFRHDSGDYYSAEPGRKSVYGNLFTYLKENHPDILEEIIPSGKSFEQLRPKNQAYLFKTLSERYGEQMPKWLLQSSPALWSQSDPKDEHWAGEILQHIVLAAQCFNHKRMGEMIIANGESVSPIQQQLLAETFGIKSAKHINLNEEKRTVENTAETSRLYEGYFGKKNQSGSGMIVKSSLSDTHKTFGMFIRPVQRTAEKDQIRLSLEFKKAVMDQKGGGLSYARGGLAPQMLPRHMLNIIEEIRQEDKIEFSAEDKQTLKQIVSFVAATIQGRAPGIMMGTPAQVYDLLFGIQEQAVAASMAIDGHVPSSLVAPSPAIYSPSMKAILNKAERDCMDKYELMRKDQSSSRSNGTERLDLYMEEVSAISMGELTNISKRGTSRPGKQKKGVADSRAIHSNKSFVLTGTMADGSFTFGHLLKNLCDAYQQKQISKEDLKEFWNKDVWRFKYMFSNAMTALANANYEHGFDKMEASKDEKRWTVARLLELTRNNYRSLSKKENMAFHAVLAVDAIEATAYLEALANTVTEGANGPSFKNLRGKDIINGLYADQDTLHKLKFGPLTTQRFSEEIENGQQMAQDMRLIFAVQHDLQARIENGSVDVQDDADLKMARQSALTHRLYGPFNMPKNLDRVDFGSSDKPVFDLIREYLDASPQFKAAMGSTLG